MRRCLFLLAFLPMLTGCYATRIVTVSPYSGHNGGYYTTVKTPGTHTVSSSARVIAMDKDISLYLDLQAVGAAFAQSSTVEEFEYLLNDASYMLSNLDLNGDGYVDYLRVMETIEGRAHVFVIQAVLAQNVYQDVATVVAEVGPSISPCVQIIGAEYIYGPRYIIQPVYVSTPLIFTHLLRVDYRPWRSPWHWDYYPPRYKRPAPLYVGHYQAYVDTYMRNHRYCHEFRYVNECHYPDYIRVSRDFRRNDYGMQHPERSFSSRNAGPGNVNPINARDIREAQRPRPDDNRVNNGQNTRPSTNSRPVTGSRPSSDARPSTQSSSAASGRPSGTINRGAGSSRNDVSRQNETQTTVRSRVNNSGTTNTRIKTVAPDGGMTSVRRGSSSTASRPEPAASSQPKTAAPASNGRASGGQAQRPASPSRQNQRGAGSGRQVRR